MSFSSSEINYIHPVNQALSYTTDWEEFKQGIVGMHTKDFEATTTEKQTFIVDEKEISVYFGISRTISTTISEAPVSLHSTLMFEFDPTDDYQFIFQMWGYAKKFVQYLCYRKDVYLFEATLSAPCDGGKHEAFANLYVLGETNGTDTDSLKKGRYIRQVNIAGTEGKILTDIAQDMLYMRHFPESYKYGRCIDASRFVMITAAFEWEFRRAYPDGLPKSQKRIEAEEAVRNTIQELIVNNTGKEKELYKFLLKSIGFSSLKSEIEKIGEDYSDVIQALGSHLYELNGEQLSYSDMGQRLAEQRNHFAHGDLDEDFIGLSLLDLIFMEYVVYAMQLKYYGVEALNIQKAINDLFRCGLAL